MAFIEPFPYHPAKITDIRSENERTKTIALDISVPWTYSAGQHAVLRLTDEQGYIAARDYSMSSAPSSGKIELTVQKAKGGEVSTWAHERLSVGDKVLLSDPLGKDFSWTPKDQAPLLLIAGGIGIAPLMSIWREHRLSNSTSSIHLAYSARTMGDVCFHPELAPMRDNEMTSIWLSRESTIPHGYHKGRIDADSLRPILEEGQKVFVCGPTSFVDAMEKMLHYELGVPVEQLFTERFG